MHIQRDIVFVHQLLCGIYEVWGHTLVDVFVTAQRCRVEVVETNEK